MQFIDQQIRSLAKVDSPTLIEAEPGSSIELVAREIHSLSARKDYPFIVVHCAGLSDTAIADQLFGHRQGAFPEAGTDRPGIFETTEGGTLFFDEICDVPLSLQIRLARVLKDKEITRQGESSPKKINIRLICGTQENLLEEVASGKFYAELMYKIRVTRIVLPPLRDRPVDIPLLVESSLEASRITTGQQVQTISDEAMRRLLQYPWPGNISELQSAIEYAVLHCEGSIILEDDLPPEIVKPSAAGAGLIAPQQHEKDRILAAIKAAKGNRTVAARLLGISRATFYRRLKEMKLTISK